MSNKAAFQDGNGFLNTVRSKRRTSNDTSKHASEEELSQAAHKASIEDKTEHKKVDGTQSNPSSKQRSTKETSNKKKLGAAGAFQNPELSQVELKSLQKNFSTLGISKKNTPNGNDVTAYKNVKWSSLGIKPEVVNEIGRAGFAFPSPVQVLSIPHAIKGRDLLVRAKNGTGKTAAFIIPILNKIDVSKGLQAIILVPIRELALQISKIFMTFGKDMGIKSVPLIGGVKLAEDIMRIKAGVHVIIGTPGRITDILGKGVRTVENNPIVVFDEADKLLDCIFYSSISELLNILPAKRQMLLYSATFPHSIEGFVRSRMNNPEKIKVSEQNLQNISQYYAVITDETRVPCLKSLLLALSFDQCIIFCTSVSTVNYLAETITALGMSAYFLHSSMEQEEKNIVYHNFSNKKCRILVSTDVTTRGIDVPGVNLVINFCLPFSSETYLHRIGRCGRFGTDACAVNMVLKKDLQMLKMYEKAIGVTILPASDPSFKSFCKK